ncbi:hypothetical protein ACWDBO_30190 [Streptomyces mirabilis]|uniref:hypothetical protein n=1 Tax=Streptomyces mirabilis TaxID=68239 RepID=UPI00332C458B
MVDVAGLGVGAEAEQGVAGAVLASGFDVHAVVRRCHADVVGEVEVCRGVGEYPVGRGPGAEDRARLAAQPAFAGVAVAVVGVGLVGVDQGHGDEVGSVVVAGAGLGAFDERADP